MLQFSMAKGRRKGHYGPYKTTVAQLGKYGPGGIKLRQWRKWHDLTIPDLADQAGLSPGTISNIENGKGRFSVLTLEALANVLTNGSIGWLFDIDPLKTTRTDRYGPARWSATPPPDRRLHCRHDTAPKVVRKLDIHRH
jgi:transcriptional regulator with XRE-family HTH domain